MNDGRKWLELTTGGVRWHCVPGCSERLFGAQGLRLDEWLRTGSAQIVKHGPHRTVYRVGLPGLSFHLKHYRLNDFRSWLRQLVRPAKARLEFERALAVAQRSVPTVVPLALGEQCSSGGPSESYLITQSLTEAESLSHFIEKSLPAMGVRRRARLAQRLALEMGKFLARLHDAGIVHNDLHAANVLVRIEDDDQPHLYLIDLHAVHLRQPLSWRASRENLILLNRWFALRASRADRYRFWLSYCQARGIIEERTILGWTRKLGVWVGHRPPVTDLACDLEDGTWRSNLRFWRHRDPRCREVNRYYYRFRKAGMVGHSVRDLEPATLQPLLNDPDAPFKRPDQSLLKNSRSSTVAELDLLVGGKLKRVIYKRFRVTTWTDPLVALFRLQPALRSWISGHGIRERCLHTPRPLAVFHRRRFGLEFEGYLITEKIGGAIDLHAWLDGLSQLPPWDRLRVYRKRIDEVARVLGEFHRRQLSHRDLKATNILLTQDAVWLIDLVGVRVYRQLAEHRRAQNLARLHASFYTDERVTRTDKLRFLRVYFQWGLFGQTGWKKWWRAIDQATLAKVAKNQRNGRPLT